MPENIHEPIRFATGGDTWFELERTGPLNRTVAEYDPDFIVWGGDLTYADGREDRYYRWEQWFETNKQTLITDEGRVIPILASIGNHEMRRREDREMRNYWYNYDDYEQTDEWREENIPYYLQFFAFPGQPGYGALDFSNYLSLLLLDTDHANPIKGEQSEWLEKRFQERQEVPHVFPVYHVPGYPSHRPFDGRTETNVRENWIPLFEQYGIRVAFENHDHTYKRTHPIRSGQISQDGIVFIGDGSWGRSSREGNNRDEWYIKAFESQRHAIIVTLHGTHQHFRVINENNEVIDEYPQLPKPIGR